MYQIRMFTACTHGLLSPKTRVLFVYLPFPSSQICNSLVCSFHVLTTFSVFSSRQILVAAVEMNSRIYEVWRN
ncbi:hypothetical protein L596_015374 [Steinernema carpocapsae]|uniref:Uncharacterized protein n=1 Tax=Steinernema carpocapsae TaxID=34508 RepID=A0A4V6A333_STECR|nr:hypothetical protein L596_015374 [Steinernema carpocapsae]